jgi:hypothetical protein
MPLSFAQRSDLQRCVARWRATFGSFDYPQGDAIALRTAGKLEALGLVRLGNRYSANRRPRWLPTEAGVDLVDRLNGTTVAHPPASAAARSGDGCGRCHRTIEPGDGFVVYQEPGGRDARSNNRIIVHGACVADEVAEGRLVRVSDFAFEVAAS